MAVPFRDLTEDQSFGFAAYLRFAEEVDGKGVRGALFFINAGGEPIDFSFCRIDVPSSFLWRSGQARQHAVGALIKSLFGASPREPALLLVLADEVSPRVFTEELEVLVPLCRVAGDGPNIQASGERLELLTDAIHLFWVGEEPGPQSAARRILDALQARNLLMEPFTRAAVGIEEAFSQQ